MQVESEPIHGSFRPEGHTVFERASDEIGFQDATKSFLELAQNGDIEMLDIAFDRVELVIGIRPTSIEQAHELIANQ